MDLSINALLQEIDEFLSEQHTSAYRLAAALSSTMSLDALHKAHPVLSNRDTLDAVRELLDSPRADEARRARLRPIYACLATMTFEARAAVHLDRIAHALRTRSFSAAQKTWTLGDALRELPRQASREGRAQLERELCLALEAEQLPTARVTDTLQHVAGEVGLSPDAFVELTLGRLLPPRAVSAERALSLTGDAWTDLLTYSLKRIEPGLKHGSASLHDAQRAAAAPWVYELFRREEVEGAVTRTMADLGFDPSAHGRISVDVEARDAKLSGAHVFEVHVPDEVRLLLTPELGIDGWAAWLFAWGVAEHRAQVSRTIPFTERRLGDRAVVDAFGLLFESLLLDEGWLKRTLHLSHDKAREAARAGAFRQTLALRRDAALTLASRELRARGPVPPVVEEGVGRLCAALGVGYPKGRFLLDADALGSHAVRLDAWALEGILQGHLRERFNEDWWRNPAAGRYLSDLASRGQRDDAAAIAATLSAPALPIAAAARRRVAVMGA